MKANSVKQKETKPMSIEEKRAELEEKLAELDVMKGVAEELLDLADTYKDRYERYLVKQEPDGLEEEQAKNYNDELLYNVDDNEGDFHSHGVSEKYLTEKGYSITDNRVTPYYRTKYKQIPVKLEDLDSYDKPRARKYKKLYEFFINLDPMTLFEE